MSRPANLPPRFPLLNRSSLPRTPDSPSGTTNRDGTLFTQQHRSPSQASFTEQPSWFDDLLTEPERIPSGSSLRRASSDSAVMLNVLTSFQSPIFPIHEDDSISNEDSEQLSEIKVEGEIGCRIEASCVYGPNSPRQKSRLTTSESSMVNAVLENVPRNPLQYLTADLAPCSNISESSVKVDANSVAADPDPEKASRRRSGQRSRVRKLQYIAELERAVDSLQTLGAELAARVASLFQLRAALSLENNQLRRQIASLRQEKVFKDGQMQSLKNEAEKLKLISSRHRRSRSTASCFEANIPFETDPSAVNWKMLDMGKLNLSGTQSPPSQGIRRL
ncbi:basic leucine zipper 61 [Ananas comosus]|uniref:Basic leucine zipper 61 n=1 Tax=Ananas comosus TaxID=4615 RepID=A0A6P5GRK4_ANACO|nr:basic leucine zipper 61 [Ananas comosus]XP_020111286.1 basic leucine zipper 61 [Ananas comosus]